jgi:hypothetical protein
MNFNNYKICLNNVNPNLPPNSALAVGNAAYHNVQLNRATNSSRRSAMMDWLSDRGITFSDRMREPGLCYLIKLCKPRFKTFIIDDLLAKHGLSVLRLLPYHPDLNQTELIWRFVKDYVPREISVSVQMML